MYLHVGVDLTSLCIDIYMSGRECVYRCGYGSLVCTGMRMFLNIGTTTDMCTGMDESVNMVEYGG